MVESEYRLALILSLFFVIALFLLSYQHFKVRGGRAFAIMTILISILSITSIAELLANNLTDKLFWRNIQQIPLYFVPITLFYIMSAFLKRDPKKTIRLVTLFSVFASVYVLLILTDPVHQLMRHDVYLVETGELMRVGVDATELNRLFSSGLTLLTFYLALTMLFKSIQARRSTKVQHWLIFTAIVLPLIHGIGTIFMDAFDNTPYAVSFSGGALALFYGLFRYRLMEIWPAASHLLYEHLNDGILVTDGNGEIIQVNQRMKRYLTPFITDMKQASSGDEIMRYFSRDHTLNRMLDAGERASEQIESDDHHHLTVEKLPIIERNDKLGYLWIVKDITDQFLKEEFLWKKATEDSLTGLYNRQFFFEQVEEKIASAELDQYCLLLLDIDFFKKVNDQYGHFTGDRVLEGFAELMRTTAGSEGFAGRIGGEEFAVFIPDAAASSGGRIGDHIMKEMREKPFEDEKGRIFYCTVSIGGVVTNSISNIDQLYQMCDRNLYESKNNGRDRMTLEFKEAKKVVDKKA
ncbi:GGDEF domain-containing protein [Jeotgalibacillus aurantiacus]|uniref:GGDEF domain-containing protein n=1 Tax=Jeotgalibacillus aurantiacus TaxID=2763266 RepID=UPI001D0B4CB7|nr:diguanylate cyclase [Jeotgalibacillus aurantiacus]